MAPEFDHEQLKADVVDVKNYFLGFLRSFGPKPKKVGEVPLGFWEERYIRFRLTLVEMGMPKIIRTVILIIVALVLFFTLFIHSDATVQLILAFIFLFFGIWLFLPHLVVDNKPTSGMAGMLAGLHGARLAVQDKVGDTVNGAINSITTPSAPSEPSSKSQLPDYPDK